MLLKDDLSYCVVSYMVLNYLGPFPVAWCRNVSVGRKRTFDGTKTDFTQNHVTRGTGSPDPQPSRGKGSMVPEPENSEESRWAHGFFSSR